MAVNVDSPASSARRRILTTAVSSLLTEAGYDHAEKMALETLVEMTQSCKHFFLIFILIFIDSIISLIVEMYTLTKQLTSDVCCLSS